MDEIDLRSDTVTQPTPRMRQAMAQAPVGDDVYGEDPTVNALEERAAALLGQEAALFCATGSLANLLGVWLCAGPGGEILCDSQAHIVRAELGAHARLHGVGTRTWDSAAGVPDPAVVAALVAEPSDHLVATKAVELENTHNFGGGTVIPWPTVQAVAALAAERGLAFHLDGARLGNASIAAGRPLADFGRLATTVTLCLSKGLGAPVGSILASSRERVAAARGRRKLLGGGWRQAGVLAAAGLYALDHNLDRLADDHDNARLFAAAVAEQAPAAVPPTVPTNIVILGTGGLDAVATAAAAAAEGVRLSVLGPRQLRAVTHLGVDAAQCQTAGRLLGRLLGPGR
ncbi:MAG: aminotransferase class I/II-fold pyridoxal phosphate-dependent enzyme [Propionibacteriaceae bacterium]|jgi:threonine aldolase|nr:aminotransferase class I/II-fold pyridoxal phosphate-dependent enzyme [Propionibacteriaceae bacterium]